MKENLQIISIDLLDAYLEQIPTTLESAYDSLEDAEISTDTFSFYVSVSSVYSSKIEGEKIELDSYIKHKKFGIEFSPDYTKKIDDLYDAYLFAKKSKLNSKNISEAHKLLSKNILTSNWQGKYRNQNMYVTTNDGKIEYVAVSPFEVEIEMKKLFDDIDYLLQTELKIEEVFYFASFIHLVFVKIHPWNDGNGKTARLLEKWFLAQKLGDKAWFIQSEKMYYENHNAYYNNIRHLGIEYSELDYKQALPFLLMLPKTI
jgi:Fic family protein